MSQENAVRFLERLASDAALAGEVADIERSAAPDAVRRLVAVAENAGYAFSESELDEVCAAIARRSSGELADDQLDNVAGGNITLQSSMDSVLQDESAEFTSVSNILKTKHDTAKNSISNVR